MARPSVERLKELFLYNPALGEIWWRSSGKGRDMTKPAGGLDKRGVRVTIDKKRYAVHRVIWAMTYGSWPPDGKMVDHIDGDVTNNWVGNLRLATNQENQRNTLAKNYSWCKQTGKWRVSLMIDGKSICFGRYAFEELAESVAKEAREKHFGEFATKGVRYR